jgi:tetratricopeptide (TPR) repeat protein
VALSPQEVQRSVAAAIEFLQAGQEEAAEAELNKVLQSDGNNRLAQSLLRQIKEDPATALGRESFPYRVQPGESLSRIAQRHLNDLHLFYILARYNNIKVPRNLAGGQIIRLPGKGPPVSASSATAPATAAPAATAAGATSPLGSTGAVAPSATPPAAQPSAPTAAATEAAAASRAAKARSDAIARHSRAARAAFAKQDLDGAIRAWDAVLELEPDNRTAQLEKQKVLGLKERLGKVK